VSHQPAEPVTRTAFDQVYEACKNWGKWGADDEVGALNYITATDIVAAGQLIEAGVSVSGSWPLDTVAGPDNPKPVLHHMTMLQDIHIGDSGDLRFTADFMGIEFHGDAHSHLDALCHVVYKGLLYNGLPVTEAVSSVRASKQTMDVAKDGIVGRGVLIDVPRLRGVDWVEPGEAIMPEEFLAAEAQTGTTLRKGDILLFRTGHDKKRRVDGPWQSADLKAGLHTSVMPILHDRQIAAIGWDGDGEAVPAHCEGIMYPIHAIGINAMGLYYMDSLYLESIAEQCIAQDRWEFFFTVAPLRLLGGTGSPCNPLAIF
jgi:kynurenine formamidase